MVVIGRPDPTLPELVLDRPEPDLVLWWSALRRDRTPPLRATFLEIQRVAQLTMQVPKPTAMQTSHSAQFRGTVCSRQERDE